MGLQGEVCEVGDTAEKSIKDLTCKTEGCYLYDNGEPSTIIAELQAAAVPVYWFRRTAPLVKHVLQKAVWLSMMDGVCVYVQGNTFLWGQRCWFYHFIRDWMVFLQGYDLGVNQRLRVSFMFSLNLNAWSFIWSPVQSKRPDCSFHCEKWSINPYQIWNSTASHVIFLSHGLLSETEMLLV